MPLPTHDSAANLLTRLKTCSDQKNLPRPLLGHGTFKYRGQHVYEGEWKSGERHGRGKFTFANGDYFQGDWVDHQMHGKGSITLSDGRKYENNWVRGREVGKRRWRTDQVPRKKCDNENAVELSSPTAIGAAEARSPKRSNRLPAGGAVKRNKKVATPTNKTHNTGF